MLPRAVLLAPAPLQHGVGPQPSLGGLRGGVPPDRGAGFLKIYRFFEILCHIGLRWPKVARVTLMPLMATWARNGTKFPKTYK